jgi:hypothetical protein
MFIYLSLTLYNQELRAALNNTHKNNLRVCGVLGCIAPCILHFTIGWRQWSASCPGYFLYMFVILDLQSTIHNMCQCVQSCGQNSFVGIVIGYWMDGPGFGAWWGTRFVRAIQASTSTHTAPAHLVLGLFLRAKMAGVLHWSPTAL